MSFSQDVHKAAKKLNTHVEKVARAVVIELFVGTIQDTPVDTGRLRGNWQTSVGTPARSRLKRTAGAAQEAKAKVKGPNVYFLSNNLPYAPVAEYGLWGAGPKTTASGYSKKAPNGMVRRNMRRVQQNVRRLAK